MVSLVVVVLFQCKETPKAIEEDYDWTRIEVTATAYNALEYQTNSEPLITAFGDSLKMDEKCIAVSRDLLKMGLGHNTPVKIEGFEGIYWVKDKMHFRWKKRIDIFMNKDIQAARAWGKKRVFITYGVPNGTKEAH